MSTPGPVAAELGTAMGDGVDTVTSLITDNIAYLFAVPAILLALKVARRLFKKIA